MRGDESKRLTILSKAEKTALYALPEFDDFQRIEFFAMADAERDLAFARKGMSAQRFCRINRRTVYSFMLTAFRKKM